jgi:uroporphyrinogen decarboxylase
MSGLGRGCAISVGPGIDIRKAKQKAGEKICLLGNLDPINVLYRGTPEMAGKEAERIIKIGKENGGYLFNSGEMIPRDTPEENMRAMIQTAKKFSTY